MKSAYIITMHCPHNYGAILQTYALQTFLQSLGLIVGVINYRPKYIVCKQSLMYVGDAKYKRNFLTRWGYRIVKVPSKIKRRINFALFTRNELNLTPEYKSYEDIVNGHLDADFFFCGSDQIWNVVNGTYKDPSYFLRFVPKGRKKISYAASGNLPLTDEVKTITIPMINGLDSISMREDSTIKSIQPYIEEAIVHVCDPVFLLNSDDWRILYKRHSSLKLKEKYVLVYPMGNGAENTIKLAKKVSNHKKLPLYMISSSLKRVSGVSKQFNVTPYDFLALIDNADCIITNSFHGISFSIILEKQFWACVAKGSNQRITSLLLKAGIIDRLLVLRDMPDFSASDELLSAKKNLSAYISQSKNFILKSINE